MLFICKVEGQTNNLQRVFRKFEKKVSRKEQLWATGTWEKKLLYYQTR